MPAPENISAAVRDILTANPTAGTPELLAIMRDAGVPGDDEKLRAVLSKTRSRMKAAAASKSVPVGKPAKPTPKPAAAKPAPKPSPASKSKAVPLPPPAGNFGPGDPGLGALAAVLRIAEASGGVGRAKELAEQVRAAGGPDAVLRVLDALDPE